MKKMHGLNVLCILLWTTASCYGHSTYNLIVVEDEDLYRYKDATDLCVEKGLYIAEADFVEERLSAAAQRGEGPVHACGFVRDHRYHAVSPVNTIGNASSVSLITCADVGSNGISPIPLAVFCTDEPNRKYGKTQYSVVFVPENRVNTKKDAKAVCKDLDSVIASSNRMSQNEGFQYCECAWTNKNSRVFKFGCTTPETLEECACDAGTNYTMYCYGVPPLPEFPVGYSPYCHTLGVYYKFLSARTGQRIKQLEGRQTACQESGGILAEPRSEEEYQCMLKFLGAEPGPMNWEVAIGFNETDLVTYSLSTGEISTVLSDHWVTARDHLYVRNGPGASCVHVDNGRLNGQRGRIIDSTCDHPYGFPSICEWRPVTAR